LQVCKCTQDSNQLIDCKAILFVFCNLVKK
jgi:hypothetical protein